MRILVILACFGLVACGERGASTRGSGTPMDATDAMVLSGIMNRPSPFPTNQPAPVFTPAPRVSTSCTRMGGTLMCY